MNALLGKISHDVAAKVITLVVMFITCVLAVLVYLTANVLLPTLNPPSIRKGANQNKSLRRSLGLKEGYDGEPLFVIKSSYKKQSNSPYFTTREDLKTQVVDIRICKSPGNLFEEFGASCDKCRMEAPGAYVERNTSITFLPSLTSSFYLHNPTPNNWTYYHNNNINEEKIWDDPPKKQGYVLPEVGYFHNYYVSTLLAKSCTATCEAWKGNWFKGLASAQNREEGESACSTYEVATSTASHYMSEISNIMNFQRFYQSRIMWALIGGLSIFSFAYMLSNIASRHILMRKQELT